MVRKQLVRLLIPRKQATEWSGWDFSDVFHNRLESIQVRTC